LTEATTVIEILKNDVNGKIIMSFIYKIKKNDQYKKKKKKKKSLYLGNTQRLEDMAKQFSSNQ
jgi:hypothetical protein